MKFGIRTDGGQNVGMGHLQRCLNLAEQLKKEETEVIFIIKKNSIVKEKIEKKEFKVIELNFDANLEEDLKFTINNSRNFGLDIVITDSYKFDEEYLRKLKKNICLLVSIDDLAKFSFPSDIVINQNIYAQDLEYYSSSGKTEFLLGPQYTLLSEEFTGIKKRKTKEKVENILITFGGEDSSDLTPCVLEAIEEIENSVKVNVIIGPFFRNIKEIEEIANKMKKKVNLIFDPPSIKEQLLASDITITAGGITLYELACAGTPTIAFCTAENQVKNIEGMEKAEIIMNAGWVNNFLKGKFKEKVKNLITNFSLREEIAEKGQKLVDGQGSMRCAKRILRRIRF